MFGEEEKFRSLLTRNPALGERQRKSEENMRIETVIMTDIAKLVGYEHEFLSKLSLDLVHMTKALNNPTQKIQIPRNESTIFYMEQSQKLSSILRELAKLVINWNVTDFSADSEFTLTLLDLHRCFDKALALRNQVTETRFIFSPFSSVGFSIHEEAETNQVNMDEILNSKSVFFDQSFVPTKAALCQLSRDFDGSNVTYMLENLNKKFEKMIKELIWAKSEYIVPGICATDFCKFPPYDVVRESKLFRDASESSSYKLNFLRTDISKMRRMISECVTAVCTLADSVKNNVIPPMVVDMQTDMCDEIVPLLMEQRKLLLAKQIVKNSGMNLSKDFAVVEFLKWLENGYRRIESGDESALEMLKSGFDRYRQKIADQLTSLEAHCEKHQIEAYQAKPTRRIDPVLDAERCDMRQRVRRLESELAQLRESLRQSYKSISSINVTPDDISIAHLVPPTFETIFQKQAAYVDPKREWMRMRLEFNHRATSELQRRKEAAADRLQMMKEEVADRRRLLEELKARKARGPPEHPVSEHRHIVLCPVCQHNIRDVFITRCGHTFCQKCITAILKQEGTSKCPQCDAFFGPTTVKNFNL